MSTLFKNATWSAASTAFRAFFGFASSLLAVRLLGIHAYGQIATLYSVLLIYVALNNSIYTILVARLMAEKDDDSAMRKAVLADAAMLTGLSILILALLVWLAYHYVPKMMDLSDLVSQDSWLLIAILLAAAAILQILSALQSATIESVGRLDLAMKAQLFGPLTLLVLLVVSFFLKRNLPADGYLIMLCIGYSVDFALLWRIRRLHLALRMLSKDMAPSWRRMGVLLISGGKLQAASLLTVFLEPLNKVLLNYFIGPAAVTSYDLAMKVVWGIQGLFGAAMRVFLHMAGKAGDEISRIYGQVVSLIGVPVLLAHTAGAILLGLVASNWVRLDVMELMVFFSIATSSNLAMILVTPLFTSLTSRGDLDFIFRSQLILAIINIVSSTLAIAYLGLVGAAVGLFVACAYNATATFIRYRQVLGQRVHHTSLLQLGSRGGAALALLVVTTVTSAVGGLTIWLAGVLSLMLVFLASQEPVANRIFSELGVKRSHRD